MEQAKTQFEVEQAKAEQEKRDAMRDLWDAKSKFIKWCYAVSGAGGHAISLDKLLYDAAKVGRALATLYEDERIDQEMRSL